MRRGGRFDWQFALLLGACSSHTTAPQDPGTSAAATSGHAAQAGAGRGAGAVAGHAGAAQTSTGATAGVHSTAAISGSGAQPATAGRAAPSATAGSAATSGPTTPGQCDPGSTTTAWATQCATAAANSCMPGTWKDPGSTTNDPLQCESAHFAVHSPAGTISAAQCMQATQTLEELVWPTLFGSPIFFPEPYCNTATKFKASIVIHSDSGLTGGGWGDGYMGMWIGPGATADHWGLAHEFTHAVQAQTKGLDCGGPMSNNFCGWLYESHANWIAHQLAEYHTSNVHCSEMLVNAPHLYLGSTRDRYCNWQFMEYLKDTHCYSAVNDIWTSAQTSNDPFTNIASTRGWTTDQLNDFFGEWALHNVSWDYRDPAPSSTAGKDEGALYRSAKGYGTITDQSKPERRLRTVRLEPMDAPDRYVVPTLQAPQRFGYNIVRLYPSPGATSITVKFRGVTQAPAESDWRWGLVATDAGITTSRYSALQRGANAELTFCVQPDEALWLVVAATPSEPQKILWDQLYPTIYRYPYMLQLTAAAPEGYQPGAPQPSAAGMRWPNGGGWVASSAMVASGAYVGPYAAVLGGSVAASARIEDHALVLSGKVSSGTVGGLTVMTSNLTVTDMAQVKVAWPYSPGFFEKPQTASGTVQLLGDIEYRGANMNKSSGSYCGFVDDTIDSNCTDPDVTTPPPYAWRD